MKLGVAACAVLTSLILAAPALAHNPVGTASQVCNEDGTITLTATFSTDYEGSTSVTATDSQAGELGVGIAPATFTSDFPGPARDGGTVTFDWEADNGHSGSLNASYEAVEGCEGPPPPDNSPPPQKPPTDTPPADQTFPGGPNHSPPPSPNQPASNPPRDTLPFSGAPVAPVAMFGFGLLGAGIALRRLQRG